MLEAGAHHSACILDLICSMDVVQDQWLFAEDL